MGRGKGGHAREPVAQHGGDIVAPGGPLRFAPLVGSSRLVGLRRGADAVLQRTVHSLRRVQVVAHAVGHLGGTARRF